MNGEHTKPVESRTEEQDAYKAILETEACARCHEGETWTVKGPDGLCIGQSWAGDEAECNSLETAEMLNGAYCLGQQSKVSNAEEDKLVAFFRSAEGDSLGRDGDADGLTPAETAIRAIRELRRQLNNAVNELTARSING